MPRKKKVPKDRSISSVDNDENDKDSTKKNSETTQQRQQESDTDSFDIEGFKESLSDFFDCKPSSIWKPFDVKRVNDNYDKCSYCKKENVDLKNCTECKAVSYCDRNCQKADWSHHKILCRKSKNDAAVSTTTSNYAKKIQRKDNCVDMTGDSKADGKGVCYYCNGHKDNLKTCVRCKGAVYCGKECQKAHWPEHKQLCRQLCSENDSASSIDFEAKLKDLVKTWSTDSQSTSDVKPREVPSNKSCLFCEKSKSKLIRCSKCKIATYCDERCRANHRLDHKVACENLPKFFGALEKANKSLADFHDCKSTEMIFPPSPHPLLGALIEWDGIAVLLKIVHPCFHPFRHAVVVQNVNGETAPMYFYHEKEEELELRPKNLGGMLAVGNFIRWFYPRWHYFMDGSVGFRIDSLSEVELLQRVTKLTFSRK